ncbi:MAG TPA: hypothetical protein VGP33_01345 [Chloroflexota bacterium]|nr:hypothetical protein [Chloroflexota bacterium]
MADEQDQGDAAQQPAGDAPEFFDQVIGRTVAALREQTPDLYQAAGQHADALAATSARLALWLSGVRPGGLRVLRLLSGYEVELTPQDPLGFVQHLCQALVGEAVTSHGAEGPEDTSKALALEIANATNQVTGDLAAFMVRSLLWQQCGGILQQTLAERAQEQELAARRGSGKRSGPEAAAEPEVAPADSPTDAAEASPPPPGPRLIRPGEPEDEGPPPPLIFPGRR